MPNRQGSIDEVAIFNSALTSGQVQTLLNDAQNPSTGGTAPEPSSLLLVGVGLLAMGLGVRWKRQNPS